MLQAMSCLPFALALVASLALACSDSDEDPAAVCSSENVVDDVDDGTDAPDGAPSVSSAGN